MADWSVLIYRVVDGGGKRKAGYYAASYAITDQSQALEVCGPEMFGVIIPVKHENLEKVLTWNTPDDEYDAQKAELRFALQLTTFPTGVKQAMAARVAEESPQPMQPMVITQAQVGAIRVYDRYAAQSITPGAAMAIIGAEEATNAD